MAKMKHAGIAGQKEKDFLGLFDQMAYIQLSLIGCPGYIIIGNSLTNPPTGHILFPQDIEGQEVWITPMFITDIWTMKRQWMLLEQLCGTVTTKKTVEKGLRTESLFSHCQGL